MSGLMNNLKSATLVALIISSFMCASVNAQEPVDSKGFMAQGRTLNANGALIPAAEAFTKAINLDPNDYEIYWERGLVYLALDDLIKSLGDFNKSVALAPDKPLLYNNRATVHRALASKALEMNEVSTSLSEYQAAISDWERALAMGLPTTIVAFPCGRAYFELASLQKKTGANDATIKASCAKAADLLQVALNDKPPPEFPIEEARQLQSVARLMRANALILMGNPSGAVNEISANMREMPPERMIEALLLRSFAYKKLGESAKASIDFEEAKKLGYKPPTYEKAAPDKPIQVESDQSQKLEQAIAPLVKQARDTLLSVKNRFLVGLPPGDYLLLTIRLYDPDKKMEQVFAKVQSWNDTKITGQIGSKIEVLKSYKLGDLVSFNEGDVFDWTIMKRDGTDEGNLIGKFLSNYHP